MRARAWLALLGVVNLGAFGLGACSSYDHDGFHVDGTGHSTTTGTGTSGYGGQGWTTSTTHTSSGTSTGSSSAGGAGGTSGTSTGSDPGEPINPGVDAGTEPDAAFECEGLDPDEPVVLYLSADDSNSMSAPGWARERLNAGQAPLSIRTYEFLNYYRIHYSAPPEGQLAIYPQAEVGADPGAFDLQIGVRSFDAVVPRRPMTITFVLDTSGSMAGTSIARERHVVKAVAQSLAAGDIVNMVTWNTSNNVVMSGHLASGPNDPAVVAAANALGANGGTDLNAGLVAGYALAQQHYGPTRLNRLMLISDGGANVGVTDENLIALHSEDADGEGIYLVGVGTGPPDSYNDKLMDTVTDAGRGAYVYVDSAGEAQDLFVNRFDEVMEVAARSVQVELTLPWYFQMKEFYGEEYSTDPTEVTPQHLAPSDAMIFNQVLQACDGSVVDVQDSITVKATWVEPISYEPMETTVSLTVDEMLNASTYQLRKGKAIVAYAEALKTGEPSDLHEARQLVQETSLGWDPELVEIAELIAKHPNYVP